MSRFIEIDSKWEELATKLKTKLTEEWTSSHWRIKI